MIRISCTRIRHRGRDWSLRVTALDQDRHGNPTELCFVDVSLRDVKTLMRGEEAVLNLPLQISDKEAGEVLVGLSFLPTAQRLSVSVLRAARLRYLQVANSLAD
ncbi:Synaptotagmin-3, partial [Gryllus bimaculatus]